MTMTGVGSLKAHSRYPGSASSHKIVDFFVPGLADLHFIAWGTAHGSVAIACAQVADAPPGSPSGTRRMGLGEQPTPLHSALVLDLCQPAGPIGGPAGRHLDEPVLHVEYGGGPHLLLAACTEQWLMVCSLEPYAANLFSLQTGGGLADSVEAGAAMLSTEEDGAEEGLQPGVSARAAASSASGQRQQSPEQQQRQRQQQGAGPARQLYRQLAAVRCVGEAITGISWTQQLDGVLVSQVDGALTMWRLQPAQCHQQQGQQLQQQPSSGQAAQRAKPASATAQPGPPSGMPLPAAATSTRSLASSDSSAGMELVPAWCAVAPAPQDLLSAGASVAHPSASSASARLDKGANIWWPPRPGTGALQATRAQVPAPQQQRGPGALPDAAAIPAARCERLKHPCELTGLEWSPGILRKDPLQMADPGTPTATGSEAALSQDTTEAAWDDHPALMTVGADGVIRIWVEMMVVVHPPSLPASPSQRGAAPPPTPSMPQVESYFCMALVIEPPQTPAPAMSPSMHSVHSAPPVAATWGRSPGCALGRTLRQVGQAAPPVLWLISAVLAGGDGGSGGAARCTLRAHAVRGLSPVVMMSYSGAMSSSGGGGGSAARPQAILWGQRAWDGHPSMTTSSSSSSSGGGSGGGRLGQSRSVITAGGRQHLSCWVTEEDEYPSLHVFWSEAGRGASQLRVQGCTLATVEEDGGSPSVHRHLVATSSWHAKHAMHSQEVCSLLPCPAAPLLASLDASGAALVWHSTPSGELHLVGPLSTAHPSASGPAQALAWAPAFGKGSGGSGSSGEVVVLAAVTAAAQLVFVSVEQRAGQPQGQRAQQHGEPLPRAPPQWALALAGAFALPRGTPHVQALHLLPSLESRATRGDASAPQLLVAAICRGADGTALQLGQFAAQWRAGGLSIAPAGQASPQQQSQQQALLRPVLSFPAAVTASVEIEPGHAGSGGLGGVLAVGLANSMLQVLEVHGSKAEGVGAAVLAELALRAAPTALAASPGAEFVAAAMSGGQDVLEVWRRTPAFGGPATAAGGLRLEQEAALALPDTPSSLAWVAGLSAQALAVGCSGQGALVFAKGQRSSAPAQGGWARLAELPGSEAPSGVGHLCLAGPGRALVAAGGGGELFTLADAVAPPEGAGNSCSLARWTLAQAGPLPQYHPAVLEALLLAGKAEAAAAILRALLAWLQTLRQHAEMQQQQQLRAVTKAQLGAKGEAGVKIGEGSPARLTSRAGAPGASGAATPTYCDVPLAQLVGSLYGVEKLAAAAAAWGTAHTPNPSHPADASAANEARVSSKEPVAPFANHSSQPQGSSCNFHPGSAVDTGQLDMVAFDMDSFAAPPQQPSASSLETGQLDMSTFGMDSFAPPPPAAAAATAAAAAAPLQQPAASLLETGQLDLGAFGMDSFAAPSQQPAAFSLETGQLDLSAFGMGSLSPPAQAQPTASPPPWQPAASSLETGQLDTGNFGMDTFPPPAQLAGATPLRHPAASSLSTGQLDMGAFGMVSSAPPAPASQGQTVAQQQAAAPPSAEGHVRLLPPPQPQPVPADRLRPLPDDIMRQLLSELASWQGKSFAREEANGAIASFGCSSLSVHAAGLEAGTAASTSHTSSQPGSDAAAAACVPGLTPPESAALLAIVRALAPQPRDAALPTAAGAGAPVDACGAHFLSAHTLARATSAAPGAGAGGPQQVPDQGAGEAPGGLGSSASAARGLCAGAAISSAAASSASLGSGGATSSALFQRHASIKNAAGVEYALPPASSSAILAAAGQGAGASEASLEEQWGLQPGLDATAVLWAVLSGTQQALLTNALQQVQRVQQELSVSKAQQEAPEASFLAVKPADPVQQTTWEMLRGLGAGFWLTDSAQAREVADRLAKAQFAARRNPDDCALLYCALGKKSVLQGLYRTSQNRRLADFLSRDFSQPTHRQAASKNAFVLLGQHRHVLAAAFFVLGGAPEEAVGVCAHEMHDVQLALFLCRVIWGTGSAAEQRVLERDILPAARQQRQQGSGGSSSAPMVQQSATSRQLQSLGVTGAGAGPAAARAGAAEAVCRWLLADAAGATLALLGEEPNGTMTAAEAVQLLPLLAMLLSSAQRAPAQSQGQQAVVITAQRLCELLCARCLAAADALQCHGVPAMALDAALAACKAEALALQGPDSTAKPALLQQASASQARLHAACALSLLPYAVYAGTEHAKQGWRSTVQLQLTELEQLGLEVDAGAVLGLLRPLVHELAAPSAAPHRAPAFLLSPACPGPLQLQHSMLSSASMHSNHTASSSHSASSSKGGPAAGGHEAGSAAGAREGADGSLEVALLGEGHVLFRVDGDKGEAVACCPLLFPEGSGGRPLVLATRRHGLVEGEVLLLPSHHAGAEASSSPSVAGSEAGSQRGSIFSRLINQMFDQSRWENEDYLESVASEGELSTAVAGAMMAAAGGGIYAGGGPPAGSVATQALCAHPTRELFLSGCVSGRVHLWQFGGRQALASFSPVPAADLAHTRASSLLSFTTRLRGSPATGKLANWGCCAALRFSANGERFAAAGEGGVVATWRLDAPGRPTDVDGAACADWWQQGLSRGARAVEYVGGSSSVVAVGGRAAPGEGNIAVWDTLAPPSSAGVGRLGQVPVSALCMLPGGWLLASGDDAGALCLYDLRMMGGGKGARVLWSVQAVHGSVTAIAWAAHSGSGGSMRGVGGRGAAEAVFPGLLRALAGGGGGGVGGIVTGGHDGAVRVWQPADGQLLQSVEGGAPAGGRGRPGSAGTTPVTCVLACPEGVVACGADGTVRLLPFCR